MTVARKRRPGVSAARSRFLGQATVRVCSPWAKEVPGSQDYFGLVMRKDDCLAGCEGIRVGDLVGLPLFCSEQSWEGDIRPWAKERFGELRLEGSFRLAYNGSVFVKEGLGYLRALDGLVDTSSENGLVFRPLSPALEVPLCLACGRRQTLTLSQSAFWISCELCLPRAEERTILRPEQKDALYARTGPAAGIRALMGRSSSTLATAARWGASWLCA